MRSCRVHNAERCAGARRDRPRHADPGRGRRQPQPLGRERGAAGHRRGVRLVADDAQPDRGRLFARVGCFGPVPRSGRRPPRSQADAGRRDGVVDPRVPPGCLCTQRHRSVRRPRARRAVGRDGVPDDAGSDRRSMVRSGEDPLDRPVVGDRRCHRCTRTAGVRLRAPILLVGIGLPDHVADRVDRARDGLQARSRARERDDRPRRQPRRHPVGGPGRLADPGDQLRPDPERDDASPQPVGDRAGGRDRLRDPSAQGRQRPLRPADRRPSRVLGRGAAPASSSSGR